MKSPLRAVAPVGRVVSTPIASAQYKRAYKRLEAALGAARPTLLYFSFGWECLDLSTGLGAPTG